MAEKMNGWCIVIDKWNGKYIEYTKQNMQKKDRIQYSWV